MMNFKLLGKLSIVSMLFSQSSFALQQIMTFKNQRGSILELNFLYLNLVRSIRYCHQHNFEILKNISLFKVLQLPVLAGLSRKSSIYKTLKISAEESLNGTSVLNTIALMNGADILRVHDVKEAKQAITLFEKYNQA